MRTVELTLESIAFGGKGIARDNGKTVFVPFTIDGETASARIIREKKQFAEAELLNILERSPHRTDPPCPYFGRCGGCAYQHIDYEHQLAIKHRQVAEVLRRIGKIQDVFVQPIVASPIPYGYRNRITVHAQDGVVGYFRRDSHQLIDVEQCPIANDEVNRELKRLRAIQPRDGHYTLRAQIGGTTAAYSPWRVSSETIPDAMERVPPPRIEAPRIFSQTNDAVGNALRDFVVGLTPEHQGLLIDAYCGAGFFAKALAHKFERIVGIDWDRFAIEEAKKNATEKETYIAGDIEHEMTAANLTGLTGQVPNRSITVIVDPPATGLTRTIWQAILDLAPATFIYVSCNPATLARDLKEFLNNYKIESVTPFDMFPQTAEIEVVAHLRRLNDSTI
jgi:tRNA/tmRNA/rRNA uracil-C5-methylase (TrmA/RlmC/RlmD family)